MEKAVMFLPSLLVLVVAIQLSYACTCTPRTYDEAMSDADAVVTAYVNSEVHRDENGNSTFLDSMIVTTIYEMYLDTFHKEGSKQLLVKGNGYFDAVIPRRKDDCGAVLMTSKKYLLSGNVTKEGTIYINNCELISLLEEETTEEYDYTDDVETYERQSHPGWV